MYIKCGVVGKAKEVLEGLPIRDAVTWSTLISGYAQKGNGMNALQCFKEMQQEGIHPNAITFASILHACGSTKALDKGRNVHSEIVQKGLLAGDTILGGALVDMYANYGTLIEAKKVHDALPVRNVVTWNALIAGYVQGDDFRGALDCYYWMENEGLSPDTITFILLLKACGSLSSLNEGEAIHIKAVRQGLLQGNVGLGNALVDMFGKCGALAKAKEVLDGLPYRDVVTWSTLIGGYAERGNGVEALNCVKRMQDEGLFPDAVTFLSILKACGRIGARDIGELIHFKIVSQRLLGANVLLYGALVDMYARCGALEEAKEIHWKFPFRDVVSWSTVIAGYAREGSTNGALNCYEQMLCEGLFPDATAFCCILKVCAIAGAIIIGKTLHLQIIKQGSLGGNVVLGGALVDMYAGCGALSQAKEVLEGLPVRNVAAWNALIAGYAQNEYAREALICLQGMKHEGLSPNAITCICTLKACGCIGALNIGENIHSEIVRQELLGGNVVLGGALVYMYAKCGALEKAKEVLESLQVQNMVAWNALISGYVQEKHGKEALSCLEQLQVKGLSPDEVTFLCVLNSCCHSGLLDDAEGFFSRMSKDHGVIPASEHYNCMVNFFGHLGLIDKAVAVIKEMPCSNYLSVWLTLLSACKRWGNLKVAKWAFEHVAQLDANIAASLIL